MSSELYGPLMLTLTLVAVLLYGMKTGGHEVVSSVVEEPNVVLHVGIFVNRYFFNFFCSFSKLLCALCILKTV